MLPKGLLKEYSQLFSLILRVLDMCAVALAGFLAFFVKFGHLSQPIRYQHAIMIACFLTLIIFQFFSIYTSSRGKNIWHHLRLLIQALCIMLISLACLAFLTKKGEQFSREWFLIWSLCSFILLIAFRLMLIFLFRIMRTYGWNERRVIIIGKGKLTDRLENSLNHALWTGYRIVSIFSHEKNQMQHNLPTYLAAHSIDEIWLALPLAEMDQIKNILHELRHETITIRYVLDFFDMGLLNHSITDLAGFPVLNIRSTPMIGINRLLKAIEDRILAALILISISPLLFFIALGIKLTSQGPIFYRQKRIGWNGKEFEMLKFRSMPVNAEEKTGPVWAKAGEARATRFGQFLRKSSLDELPQFINVFLGDMSIVGPRPERPFFVDQFKEQIPRYMQKHVVKAGITGWAQIHGWRGNTSLEKRIEYDLFYIEHWSLFLDLKIIFLTFFYGFLNKNAY